MTEYDAVVIGAGPAGSAAAAALASRGRRTLVLERDRFPRRKVCGEFLSGRARESLARLDLLAAIAGEAEPIERGSLHLRRARSVPFALASRAFGISRRRLDTLLARRAEELGAELRFGARVLSVEPGPRGGARLRVAAAGGEEEILGRGVVGAWGRWDVLDRSLGRGVLRRRGRFSGWSRDYDGVPGLFAREVRLYLFPGGYCGLSRVEHGRIHLAGVISERRRRSLPNGWQAVVAHARFGNPELDRDLAPLDGRESPEGDLGTGPIYFTTKRRVEGGALMAGDAAGVIDPFLGEGIAAAMASGILAGEALDSALAGRLSMESAAEEYARAWKREFRGRVGWGSALRRLMLHPAAASLAARLGGEGLVRTALTRLAAGRA